MTGWSFPVVLLASMLYELLAVRSIEISDISKPRFA